MLIIYRQSTLAMWKSLGTASQHSPWDLLYAFFLNEEAAGVVSIMDTKFLRF